MALLWSPGQKKRVTQTPDPGQDRLQQHSDSGWGAILGCIPVEEPPVIKRGNGAFQTCRWIPSSVIKHGWEIRDQGMYIFGKSSNEMGDAP
jgi:hypothetical protein